LLIAASVAGHAASSALFALTEPSVSRPNEQRDQVAPLRYDGDDFIIKPVASV